MNAYMRDNVTVGMECIPVKTAIYRSCKQPSKQ